MGHRWGGTLRGSMGGSRLSPGHSHRTHADPPQAHAVGVCGSPAHTCTAVLPPICSCCDSHILTILYCLVPLHVPYCTQASLKRMQLDYVDLLYCHRPDPQTPIEETVRAMNW